MESDKAMWALGPQVDTQSKAGLTNKRTFELSTGVGEDLTMGVPGEDQ